MTHPIDTNTATAPALEDVGEFLTPAEAVKLLKVSRASLYNAILSGDLPALRIGKHLRIPRAALVPGAVKVQRKRVAG